MCRAACGRPAAADEEAGGAAAAGAVPQGQPAERGAPHQQPAHGAGVLRRARRCFGTAPRLGPCAMGTSGACL